MTYTEAIDYLYVSQPAFHIIGAAAYKPGLDNTRRLLAHIGDPHLHFRSVHIAGTNGKGSTSHLIAAALQSAGLRVGLYTSPHLVDFRERIRINGAVIPEEEVVRFVADNQAFLEEVKPSFFETTMAMAFAYFAAQQVDVAVIETGLGGRLDSTNIITPMLSVITNIGFDHMEFLGNTLPAIAGEKAGIIKPHVPCVIGESNPETDPVFLQHAQQCDILGGGLETTDCRLWFADQCGFMRRTRLRDIPICQLGGIYQEKNQQTAYVALRVLQSYSPIGQAVTTDAIRRGFASVCTLTGLRGRWEVLSERPLIICDTGHNAHGLRYVAQQLRELYRSRLQQSDVQAAPVLRIVFGMVSDKDVTEVMRLMPPATYYFTQPDTQRAIPAERMLQLWREVHPEDDLSRAIPCSQDAFRCALAETQPDDILFVGGSNYLVGTLLRLYPHLNNQK